MIYEIYIKKPLLYYMMTFVDYYAGDSLGYYIA